MSWEAPSRVSALLLGTVFLVMRNGLVVEQGPAEQIFEEPGTPSTRGLMAAAFEIGRASGGAFDVTVAPLVNLWGFGPEERPAEPPAPEALEALRDDIAAMENVDAMAARAISRVPDRAAAKGPSPSSWCRKMFSSTTMASSITTPTDSARASVVRLLSENPKIRMKPKVATSEVGIASDTMKVDRQERRKTKTTRMASTAP